MFYHIETKERTAGGRTGPVYTLQHAERAAVEIWPAHGFNALRWRVNTSENWQDVLYSAPDWETNPVPTRSGTPILFPFPNRIRDGRFRFGMRDFQLPLNDPAKKNGIHGFAPRHAWRVVDQGADEQSAWVHGEFDPTVDAPETVALWPSTYRLSMIYRLIGQSLRIEMKVQNTGETTLPFGVGLHPYFRFPCSDPTVDRYKLFVPARSIWNLIDNLPTGEKELVPDEVNFNSSRSLTGVNLDTLYTGLGVIAEEPDGMVLRADIGHATRSGAVQIWTTRDFRESVLYIPPHRQAVCIEPYTCPTDAINLQGRGIDAGWLTLPLQGQWAGVVMFRWNPAAMV